MPRQAMRSARKDVIWIRAKKASTARVISRTNSCRVEMRAGKRPPIACPDPVADFARVRARQEAHVVDVDPVVLPVLEKGRSGRRRSCPGRWRGRASRPRWRSAPVPPGAGSSTASPTPRPKRRAKLSETEHLPSSDDAPTERLLVALDELVPGSVHHGADLDAGEAHRLAAGTPPARCGSSPPTRTPATACQILLQLGREAEVGPRQVCRGAHVEVGGEHVVHPADELLALVAPMWPPRPSTKASDEGRGHDRAAGAPWVARARRRRRVAGHRQTAGQARGPRRAGGTARAGPPGTRRPARLRRGP